MIGQPRTRIRIRMLAAALACLGMLLWVSATMLHLTAADARDVSVGHMRDRSIAIVAGGASVAGAIALLIVAI